MINFLQKSKASLKWFNVANSIEIILNDSSTLEKDKQSLYNQMISALKKSIVFSGENCETFDKKRSETMLKKAQTDLKNLMCLNGYCNDIENDNGKKNCFFFFNQFF